MHDPWRLSYRSKPHPASAYCGLPMMLVTAFARLPTAAVIGPRALDATASTAIPVMTSTVRIA